MRLYAVDIAVVVHLFPEIKMYCIFEPAYGVVLNRPFSLKSCCAGWLTGWLVGWLVCWLPGWFVGWFVGWLVGFLHPRSIS